MPRQTINNPSKNPRGHGGTAARGWSDPTKVREPKTECETCTSTYGVKEQDGKMLCRWCRTPRTNPPHGTQSRYLEGPCRCGRCCQANAEAVARTVLRHPDRYPDRLEWARSILGVSA